MLGCLIIVPHLQAALPGVIALLDHNISVSLKCFWALLSQCLQSHGASGGEHQSHFVHIFTFWTAETRSLWPLGADGFWHAELVRGEDRSMAGLEIACMIAIQMKTRICSSGGGFWDTMKRWSPKPWQIELYSFQIRMTTGTQLSALSCGADLLSDLPEEVW